MFKSLTSQVSSVLLASVLLSGCSGVIGSPQVSIEEIRASYDVEEELLLIAAVKSGNLKHVKALIKAGFDVNVRDNYKCPFFDGDIKSSGSTPLLYAAREGNLEIVQELIKAGADVNAKTNCGYDADTPLHKVAGHWEVNNGHLEIVRELIKAGADVNVKGGGNSTPLHSAAREGNSEIVQELIKAGADVNVKTNGGWTPLLYAVGGPEERHTGNLEIVQELVRAGADVNVKGGRNRQTPLLRLVVDDGIASFLIENGATE